MIKRIKENKASALPKTSRHNVQAIVRPSCFPPYPYPFS